MARPMTWSEQLVGRRKPRDPTHRDVLLASFCKGEEFGVVSEPGGHTSYLRPAFRKLQKEGMLRLHSTWSIMSGRPFGMWVLTEKGKAEARSAFERVRALREANAQFGRDIIAAHRARQRDPEAEALSADAKTPEVIDSTELSP